MSRMFDPLGARGRYVYAWLGVFFLRLAVWHLIEERWGRA